MRAVTVGKLLALRFVAHGITRNTKNKNKRSISEVELSKGDAEGLEGVDGGAIVEMESVFPHLASINVGGSGGGGGIGSESESQHHDNNNNYCGGGLRLELGVSEALHGQKEGGGRSMHFVFCGRNE